jgi:hypothetical protein
MNDARPQPGLLCPRGGRSAGSILDLSSKRDRDCSFVRHMPLPLHSCTSHHFNGQSIIVFHSVGAVVDNKDCSLSFFSLRLSLSFLFLFHSRCPRSTGKHVTYPDPDVYDIAQQLSLTSARAVLPTLAPVKHAELSVSASATVNITTSPPYWHTDASTLRSPWHAKTRPHSTDRRSIGNSPDPADLRFFDVSGNCGSLFFVVLHTFVASESAMSNGVALLGERRDPSVASL